MKKNDYFPVTPPPSLKKTMELVELRKSKVTGLDGDNQNYYEKLLSYSIGKSMK